MKNKILAIPAALAAMPPNPKIAAIIATTKKMIVQRNITKDLIVYNGSNSPALHRISIIAYRALRLPAISDTTNKAVKMKNRTLATPTTWVAIPANPKIPAMIAIIMKTIDQRNITKDLIVYNGANSLVLNNDSPNNDHFLSSPPMFI
jgi:hypothetical protein